GAGKSSLLKIIARIETPQAGECTLRRGATVAYLEQEYAGSSAATALEEVIGGHTELAALEAELSAAERALADPALLDDPDAFDRVVQRQAVLLEQIEAAG